MKFVNTIFLYFTAENSKLAQIQVMVDAQKKNAVSILTGNWQRIRNWHFPPQCIISYQIYFTWFAAKVKIILLSFCGSTVLHETNRRHRIDCKYVGHEVAGYRHVAAITFSLRYPPLDTWATLIIIVFDHITPMHIERGFLVCDNSLNKINL